MLRAMRPFRDRTEGLLFAALAVVTLGFVAAAGLQIEAALAQGW